MMFAHKDIDRVLLTDKEINQLINGAQAAGQRQQQLIAQGQMGEFPASVKGAGSDFADLRGYYSGDDIRHIDWRATARSQQPLVRTYYSEFSQPVCLLIDRRAAMRFATRVRLKVTQALRMALWLGGQYARSGREIAALLLDSKSQWLPAQSGVKAVRGIAKYANKACPPAAQELSAAPWKRPLSSLIQQLPTGSEVILLSDFSALNNGDLHLLRLLGQQYTSRAIHILDPFEIQPSFSSTLKIRWADKQRVLNTSDAQALKLLTRQLKERREEIAQLFSQAAISYTQLSVEQDDLSAVRDEQLL